MMAINRLAIALSFAITLYACGGPDETMEERLRPVRFVVVDDSSVFRDRSFSGTSKSRTESRLSFKVAGTIVNRPVQNGQRLQPGDLIAEIDDDSYVLQSQQAQASLIEAEANDRRASANYERTKGLYANDNASLNDLEAARAESESAKAVVAAATKALEIARLNVSYTRLVSDGDCSIASLDIEVNENVGSGQQVASVSCGDDYEVTLDLPESLIGSVDEFTPVQIEFGAIEDTVFDGTVTEVSVAAAAGSAAFPVVIDINNRHPDLRSGLAADVTFQFDANNDGNSAVVLPVSAVVNDPQGTYVYLATASNTDGVATVERRDVSLGELSQAGVEVVTGLQTGDRVITAGISAIREGQSVLVNEENRAR